TAGPEVSSRSPRAERSERVRIPNRIITADIFHKGERYPFGISRVVRSTFLPRDCQREPSNNISNNLWPAILFQLHSSSANLDLANGKVWQRPHNQSDHAVHRNHRRPSP